MIQRDAMPPKSADVRWRGLLAAVALVTLGLAPLACEENRSRPGTGIVDSETHWLDTCENDSICGDLQCLCGICTLPCAEVRACDGLTAAVCATAACGAQGICTRACETSGDCAASGVICSAEGTCVPTAVPTDGAVLRDAFVDARVADGGPPDLGGVDFVLPPDLGTVDQGPDDAGGTDSGLPIEGCAVAGSTCQNDAQCGLDETCGSAIVGGPCGCIARPARQRTECPAETCCLDTDCPTGGEGLGAACVFELADRQQNGCGGRPPGPDNQCLVDDCRVNADCGGGQACVRPGQFGFVVATCVTATCRSHGDCTDHAGGECTPFFQACNNFGFWCTYDEDPCRTDADCLARGADRVCQPFAGQPTQCVPESPPPP